MPQINVEGRHPSVQDLAKWFDYEHLSSPQREFSQQCYDLAANMIDDLPDSLELTAGLRKLLEAKDCFVRASVALENDRRAAEAASQRADELQEERKEGIVKQSADVEQYFEGDESPETILDDDKS